jgi:AhpD family alkylhydroperoxidase
MTTTPTTDASTREERAAARRAKARVPLDEPTTLLGKAVAWYSRREFGEVVDNGLAMLHNPPVLKSVLGFERKVDKWDALDPDLKALAQAVSAAVIGCSWCMDFGYFALHSKGLDVSRLEEVPRWRESDVFSPLERQVLEYAEAMTVTPPEVTDDMAEALRAEIGNAAFVELTMMVAVENERSRFNSALGLTSQGFKDFCGVPGRA